MALLHQVTGALNALFLNKNKKKDVQIILNIAGEDKSDKLNNIIFMKINDKKTEFIVTNRSIESKSATYTDNDVDTKTSKDFTTEEVVVKTTVTTETQTITWKELKGKITLGNNIDEQILTCKTLTLRLYSGNKPITFIIDDKDISLIKKFIKLNRKIKHRSNITSGHF